jgi:hypothetical protein
MVHTSSLAKSFKVRFDEYFDAMLLFLRSGLDVVKKIETYGTKDGKPRAPIKIVKCGQL